MLCFALVLLGIASVLPPDSFFWRDSSAAHVHYICEIICSWQREARGAVRLPLPSILAVDRIAANIHNFCHFCSMTLAVAWVLPPTSLSAHTSAYQTAAYGPHSCVKVLAYDLRSSSIPHR